MFSFRILLVVLFLNSFYLSISQEYSAYQPTMPCSSMENSLKWSFVEEDLKDFLIVQSLIGEEKFEDLQVFLEKQGYTQATENFYSKPDRFRLDEIYPVIYIYNTEQSYIDDGYGPIASRVFFRANEADMHTNQTDHNRIWLFLMETFEKGLPYNMFKDTIEFHEKEGSEINYIDKYHVETTSSDNEVETFSASNFISVTGDNDQKKTYGVYFGPSQNLMVQITAYPQKEGDECRDDIYFSTLELFTTNYNPDRSIDVELFKETIGLNQIIWQDYQ